MDILDILDRDENGPAKDMDIIKRFRENYKNVEEFEGKYDVKLPEDIAVMMTPEQA